MLLKNATIVDGTGNPKYVSDIRIENDIVTEIGSNLIGNGIDCSGKIVTPGFFDIHTHYDAELFGSADLTLSTNAGVSHIIIGNCGVGVYPFNDKNELLVKDLLEGVEDIPAHNRKFYYFKNFNDYITHVNTKSSIKVDSFLPYSCIRSYVLGQNSQSDNIVPTKSEFEQIINIIDDGLSNGAMGVSFSKSIKHKSSKGVISPSFYSSNDEFDLILKMLSKYQKPLQYVSDLNDGKNELINLYNRLNHANCMALVTLQIPNSTKYNDSLFLYWKNNLKNRIMVQVHPRANAVIYGKNLPYDINNYSNVDLNNLYPIIDGFDYEPKTSLNEVHNLSNKTIEECIEQIKLFYKPNFNYYNKNLDNVRKMLSDKDVLVGLTDAGAHQAKMLDSSSLLWMIKHYAKDYSIEYLVNKCTNHNAKFFNQNSLHTITLGSIADINLIDLDNLSIGLPKITGTDHLKFTQTVSGISRPNGFVKV